MNDGKINLLHEEESFVVVEKISGFLSVPGRGEENYDSVASRVKESYSGCIPQPAVHRLDMDTSGILVLARTKEAHRNLSIQFQERQTEKKYYGLLDGELEDGSGTIELPFRLDVDNRPHQIYDEVHGKMGVTKWQKITVENGLTRILFEPITGRTHQLRVHSAHEKGLGIPIVGDPLYGNAVGNGQLKLHAAFLSFSHPGSGERLFFHSEVPF
ncbi:MAG: RluA family pseudouridine synthase [Lentisphaerales bacterium]|nr:RluA family pseudouridine synthase [Lentisphaerales bacterium]